MPGSRTEEEVLHALNNACDQLFVTDADGNKCPPVCIVCDRLIHHEQKTTIKAKIFQAHKKILQTEEVDDLSQELKNCYTPLFAGNALLEDAARDVLLSPRSVPMKSTRYGRCDSFLICKECKSHILKDQMPDWAIANGYFFGTPPKCITELTDIERAFITPVKAFGYICVWTGGPNQKLKGTLAFYKRNETSIANTACQLEILGLTDDGVKVILAGKMTKQQRKRAKEKTKIRPNMIIEAVRWLIENNREWQGINLDALKEKLKDPILIMDDKADEVESVVGSNIENEEVFKVYFPDSDIDTTRGGQSSATEFIRQALESKKNRDRNTTTEVEIDVQLYSERVQEYRDSNLMGACIMQYPYGRGGLMSEIRYDEDESIVYPKHEEYVEYLSALSQGHFHSPLFCLILYNYLMKEWMVRTAVVRTRGKSTAESIAEKMGEDDLMDVMRLKDENIPITSEVGRFFVKAIDAVAGAAPHSNEAAKKARRRGETLMHHFGMPALFFTVTPDDEYNTLLDV